MKTFNKIVSNRKLIPEKNYLLIASLWLLAITLVNPLGEFPLNDDWAYSKDVLNFLTNGRLDLIDWSAMTLVAQIIIGTAWCKIFTFSFTLLRLLTTVIGLIGILTTYKILKDLKFSNRIALFVCLIMAGNPLYFNLSNTFMTDVYFYTFSILSILFYNRNFRSNNVSDIAIATIFILIATLIRQIGIIIPISVVFASYYHRENHHNKLFYILVWLSLFMTLLILSCYNYWHSISVAGQTSYFYVGTIISNIGTDTFWHIYMRTGSSGMTLGLFLFPLLILLLPNYMKEFWKKENILSIAFTIALILPLTRAWANIPLGNVFNNFSLGPKLLKDVYVLHINNDVELGNISLNVLRTFSFAGGVLLFYYLFRNLFAFINGWIDDKQDFQIERFKLISFMMILLFFGTFVIPDFFFDRYLIQLFFPVCIVILPPAFEFNLKNRISPVVISLAIFFGVISVCLTHDYLSWNRARWQGISYLMKDLKKSPHAIDGGFEFNGWYQTGLVQDDKNKSWWFVDKDDYILTFGPIPGYKTVKMFSYVQYIPYRKSYIYILNRIPIKV